MIPGMSARDEIGRALAAKIRDTQKVKDISSIVEEVLPAVEKLLETPEERRLRRIRVGVITASLGLAATLFSLLIAAGAEDRDAFAPLVGATLIPFLIGLGIVLNGLLFTVPKGGLQRPAASSDDVKLIQQQLAVQLPRRQEPSAAAPNQPSVTEHTTHQLKDELARSK
jgi:hypothetical protein